MQRIIKAGGTEFRNMLLTGLCVIALGAGTATAAISIGVERGANPAIRTLTVNRGVSMRPVRGPEDEDCVRVTRCGFAPDGRETLVHTLECAE